MTTKQTWEVELNEKFGWIDMADSVSKIHGYTQNSGNDWPTKLLKSFISKLIIEAKEEGKLEVIGNIYENSDLLK